MEIGQLVGVNCSSKTASIPVIHYHVKNDLGVMGYDVGKVVEIVWWCKVFNPIASCGFQVGHDTTFKVGEVIIVLEGWNGGIWFGKLSPYQCVGRIAWAEAGRAVGFNIDSSGAINVGWFAPGPGVPIE